MYKWLKTIVYVVISAVLAHLLPFSSFFKNVDTLIHESGHAFVTLLLSGHVMSMELNEDHSGVTYSAIAQHWAMVPVGLAGYMTASLYTWFLFAAYRRERYKIGIMVTTAAAVTALILFVHNGFGFGWLLGFAGLNLVMLVFAGKQLNRYYLLLLAFLSLEESVFSPLWLNFSAVQNAELAGDATELSHATGVPALVFTIWFTLFALWCAKRAIIAFTGQVK